MEFLYFYLMPETPSIPKAGEEGNLLQRSSSELGRAFAVRQGNGGDPNTSEELEVDTLSCERKQEMLGQHLSNVADLVKDLEHYSPFGGPVGK